MGHAAAAKNCSLLLVHLLSSGQPLVYALGTPEVAILLLLFEVLLNSPCSDLDQG